MRNTKIFPSTNPSLFKKKALQWAEIFPSQCLLDHNAYSDLSPHYLEGILAIDAEDRFDYFPSERRNGFEKLEDWLMQEKSWAFGFLSYDLKNEVEDLKSQNPPLQAFPLIHFFRPKILIEFFANSIRISSNYVKPEHVFEQIQKVNPEFEEIRPLDNLDPNFDKKEYLETIKIIQDHIQFGDIYEMNFCMSYLAKEVGVHPRSLFNSLTGHSEAPFSAYFRMGDKYILSGSPERFLSKTGNRIVSQPIKGTRPRRDNIINDEIERNTLQQSPKDRSENVMIVDLVRNDLARSCTPGSIKVEELFGIYSFKTVHQMISTISGNLADGVTGIEAIRNAFPMGSMTGAPKIKAMQLIDQFERNSRGIYSGSIGYFTPEGDFDFNVVIRSILLDQAGRSLSFQVGGAIVADSIPENEYQECLLKAEAMMRALGLEHLYAEA
ncbi:MAG: anthranilate synthase component I family protein [Saprospiraceae bacterium]|nr:anthranilate synthase component I family protein [Saprospiraceae bacterium]